MFKHHFSLAGYPKAKEDHFAYLLYHILKATEINNFLRYVYIHFV